MSDAQLLSKLKSDDKEAFTELFNRYWDRIYAIAYNKMYDHYWAEEIVQDLFLDLWRRRESLSLEDNIVRYLSVALKYRIITARNRNALKQQYIQEETGKQHYYSLEDELRFLELSRTLATTVASLPEKCQLVYKLSREDGLTHDEIAYKLNISNKTVEAHLTRALKVLRSRLKGFNSFFMHLI